MSINLYEHTHAHLIYMNTFKRLRILRFTKSHQVRLIVDEDVAFH
jgi:hypothetical protein